MFLDCIVESLISVLPELAILATRALTKLIENRSKDKPRVKKTRKARWRTKPDDAETK